MVTIVLPTYNGSKYIQQSIESCLNQTYNNIELIIVNDASTDSTEHIVLSYQDPRIVYVKNDVNQGLAKSLNIGFSKSRGDYLTWASDDNYYLTNAISEMINVLESNHMVDFVFADYYNIDENGNILNKRQVGPVWQIIKKNCIGACFLYKRLVYEKVGNFNADRSLAEDYEYWLRVYKKFKMMHIVRPLLFFRLHKDSLTSIYGAEEAFRVSHESKKGTITVWDNCYFYFNHHYHL